MKKSVKRRASRPTDYQQLQGEPEGSYSDEEPHMLQVPNMSPISRTPQLQPSLLLPQLNRDEKDFFDLISSGNVSGVAEFLQEAPGFNINCEDYQGRTALVLSVLLDNEEIVHLLLQHGNLQLGDSLLHAAKIGNCKIVEMLLEKQRTMRGKMKLTPSADFTEDITPIILAAHQQHYELIRLLLDHGYTIEKPHPPGCFCVEKCAHKKKGESLSESVARINVYKALTSPAYISQCSSDPILTAFKLSQEMVQYAEVDREFKMEYLALADQCQQYAVDLLHQCRTTEEVEKILGRKEGHLRKGFKPTRFTRLNLAVDLQQKKFVAHSNCQQILRKAWLQEWQDWKGLSFISKLCRLFPRMFLLPVMVVIYLMSQFGISCKFIEEWRSPINKFLFSTASYVTFLVILLAQNLLSSDAFHRGPPNTGLEWIIIIYVFGLIWAEIKQVWFLGWKNYFTRYWNWYDMLMFTAFLSAFTAWLIAYCDVQLYGNGSLDRRYWESNDPTLVGEGLFAIATVFAFARVLYIFQIGNTLGPVQVSVSKMFGDITEFLAMFSVILFSFACGLNSLYHYYKNEFRNITGYIKTQHYGFNNFQTTMKTLFWAIFGLAEIEAADVMINTYEIQVGNETVTVQNKHKFTEGVGFILFGIYHVVTIVILLNLLIAMMTNTYTRVEENADVEWKFARTTVWLSYFEEGGTLPPPFNLIPSPKSLIHLIRWFIACCCRDDRHTKFSLRSLMRQLVQRDMRQKASEKKTARITCAELDELKQQIRELKQLTNQLVEHMAYAD